MVKAIPENDEPVCYSSNKKGSGIFFTTLPLVVDCLAMLSEYSTEELAVSVITPDVKDFASLYKCRQGKLFVISHW